MKYIAVSFGPGQSRWLRWKDEDNDPTNQTLQALLEEHLDLTKVNPISISLIAVVFPDECDPAIPVYLAFRAKILMNYTLHKVTSNAILQQVPENSDPQRVDGDPLVRGRL